jgi:DNA-binding IclR family transcriptional regulator
MPRKTAARRIAIKATQPVVLQALHDHGSMTIDAVLTVVALSRAQVHSALQSLVASGRAVRTGDDYAAADSPMSNALRQATSVWQYAARVGAMA